jgi:O-6-methylguanine DNA methyltransferase
MGTTDQEDSALKSLFAPLAAPAGLGDRVLRTLRAAREEDVVRLVTRLDIAATPEGIAWVRLGRRRVEATGRRAEALVERAREELSEYLAGTRSYFTVPVDLSELGKFQRAVLSAARAIPFGEVRSYRWVAERIGRPRAVRAVGTALGRNPVPLIVPCHRVLRSDGGVGGYLFGTRLKDFLLELERTTPVLEGCTTTRIVCRVGCIHGRHMRPENRVVFASVTDARSIGYRPCRVCGPEAAA